MSEERYFLAYAKEQWFLVPVSASAKWYRWLGDMNDYKRNPDDFVREPDPPEEVDAIDNTSTVTFSNPLIEPF